MTAIPDNRSWNPRVFIGLAVILPDLSNGISFSLQHVHFIFCNFLFNGLSGTAFLFHFNWNIFMKSYAGNWQINRNSRNRMSKKILSERIPLNGQWNNRTSQTWPETRHGCEGRSRTSFFFSQNWRNQMTEQYRTIGPEIQGFLSDRRSFYRTCQSVRRYFVFTVHGYQILFSIQNPYINRFTNHFSIHS